MKKFFQFIINPKSGNSLDVSALRHLREVLLARGHRVQVDLTRSLKHAGELARQAVQCAIAEGLHDESNNLLNGKLPYHAIAVEDCPVHIVVAGGDGTVREVAGAIHGRCVPVLLVPTGTENLLAQELGLDGTVDNALAALDSGMMRALDLGKVNDHSFMSVIGVGFDAQVVKYVHSRRSGHITPLNYIWPICRTFWEYKFPPIRVEIDGEFLAEEPGLVFVSNVSRYAAGLIISPQADCGDGYFDLTFYICKNQIDLLHHSVRTAGRFKDWPGRMLRRRCHKIHISSPCENLPIEIDGDPYCTLPLQLQIVPSSAWMLVPPGPQPGQHCPPVKFYHLKRWVLK